MSNSNNKSRNSLPPIAIGNRCWLWFTFVTGDEPMEVKVKELSEFEFYSLETTTPPISSLQSLYERRHLYTDDELAEALLSKK